MSSVTSKLPRSFVRVGWSGVLVQFAEQVSLAAAPLVAVLVFSASPAQTAVLQVAHTLPFLLFAIPVGLLVDRLNRSTVLIVSESLRAVTLALTIVLLVTEVLTFPQLVLIGFLGAVGTVAFSVAMPAVVPQLVDRDQLIQANRWVELGRSAALIAGPASAGMLASWLGASSAFVVATTLCVLGILLLLRLDIPPQSGAPRRPILRDLREAARFGWSIPVLRTIILTSFVFNIGWFIIQAIFVVYAVDILLMTPVHVGYAIAASGVGMAVGAAVSPAITRRLSLGGAALLGPLGGFGAALALATTLVAPTSVLAVLSYFLFGFGPVIWAITTTSIRQAITPVEMLGRVSSLLVVATYGARPVGAALAALVSVFWGTTGCLLLATALFAAQLLYVALSPLAKLRSLQGAATANSDPSGG